MSPTAPIPRSLSAGWTTARAVFCGGVFCGGVFCVGVCCVALLAPASALAAPTITFTAPTEADEGQSVTIGVEVTDPEGAVSWSWDLDGDGTFGEMSGATTYVVPAGTTDGPEEVRVSVEATGPTETLVVAHAVSIRNVPPDFNSEPGLTAGVRREYRYDITFVEPAGDADPVSIRLTSRPPGMEIEGQRITWVPEPDQRGRTFPAILRVDDGDGGENAQMWSIAIDANTTPTVPVPMAPIEREQVPADMPVTLTVTNSVDLDEDPLTYVFRLSRVSSFDDPDVIESEETPEGEGETTSWTTSAPLAPGLWYWQAYATDGMEESPRLFAQLVVEGEDLLPPDGGIGPGGGSGGCAVGSPLRPAPSPWAQMLAVLMLAVVLLKPRRRRAARAHATSGPTAGSSSPPRS